MKWIVGIDEVGRGPLAGPVCVCAVAMPQKYYKKALWTLDAVMLTDSKKMTPTARMLWRTQAFMMRKNEMLRIGIKMHSASRIDRQGISACIKSCIECTLDQLQLDPNDCTILLDGGLKAPLLYKRQQTVIRGDSAHPIISLAAVVAKVHRDIYMQKLHKKHQQYRWNENKGYGTLVHRAAIREFGPSPLHRKSFISKVIS